MSAAEDITQLRLKQQAQDLAEQLADALGQHPGVEWRELCERAKELATEHGHPGAETAYPKFTVGELVDIIGGLDAIGVTRTQARAVRDSRSEGSASHFFWASVADGLLESAPDVPAPDVPAPPTHQDVVNAVRARIVAAAADLEVEETGLAALVTAYNGTDGRESAAIFDRVSAVLPTGDWCKDTDTAAEIAQRVALALVGGS